MPSFGWILWPVVVATDLSLERESGVLAVRIKGTTKPLLLWVSLDRIKVRKRKKNPRILLRWGQIKFV